MSADRILQKIRQDAEAEAAAIRSAAQEKAEALTASILSEAQKKADAIAAKAAAEAEEIERRRLLIAGLEARKNKLSSKRAVLDQAYDLAYQELCGLSGERWARLITACVLSSCETGREVLRVPAGDISKYRSDFLTRLGEATGHGGSMLDHLNSELRKAGKEGALTLDETPAPFEGGVLIVGEKSDVNCSFEALLRAQREENEREIAALLFGVEVS